MKLNELDGRRYPFFSVPITVLAGLAYIVLLWLLLQPFLGWIVLSKTEGDSLKSALHFDRSNPTYHYFLARHYHLHINRPDMDMAVEHYRRSLALSPLQPGAWIDISKAYQSKGQNTEAEYALERAVRISPNNPELMWEAGTFWLINNALDKAATSLRQYLLLLPDRQNEVYDLGWKLRLDNNYIFSALVPNSYVYHSKYLLYLINTKRIHETGPVWSAIEKENLEKKVFVAYVNALINSSEYDRAASAWKEITGRMDENTASADTTLVWNPHFEKEILNGGLDWIVNEGEGVDVFLDDTVRMTGSRSIGVTFDGKHNPDVTILQQVVLVKPGTRYTLRGYVKTSSITTTNGVFLGVQGHNCSMTLKKSDAITGTSFWKELSVDFETPDGCNAIVIRVRREKSAKLDNKIEGTAWIDGITLKQQADLPKSTYKKL